MKVLNSLKLFGTSLLIATAITVAASTAMAALQSEVTPFETFQQQINISANRGNTYLSFMQAQVKPALDSFQAEINEADEGGNYRAAVMQLLNSGHGAAIRIDDANYVLNVGYLTGASADDVKSGRSFGISKTNRQSDPSDLAYLTELEQYLKTGQDVESFYRSLLATLTNCDTSGWSGISTDGQVVATDFVAIYTAESDRHLMVQLDPKNHPWENDLAGATFVSIVDVQSGKIMQNGQLVDSSIKNWWAKGRVGSGIGETRRDRLAMQKKISAYERAHHPELISAIEATIGENRAGGDVIQGLMEFLNNPQAPQSLGHSATELTEAFVKFLMQAGADAEDIVAQ